jgi:hypothetical protein
MTSAVSVSCRDEGLVTVVRGLGFDKLTHVAAHRGDEEDGDEGGGAQHSEEVLETQNYAEAGGRDLADRVGHAMVLRLLLEVDDLLLVSPVCG